MDQPPAVAFTAFADAWPRAVETEIGAALCAIGRGKGLNANSGNVALNRKKRTLSYVFRRGSSIEVFLLLFQCL